MPMDTTFDINDILKRAKRVRNFTTDTELAAYLGVSRPTVSNWISRKTVDFPLLLSKFSDVDYNWLLTGKGSPTHRPNYCDSELVKGEVQMLYDSKSVEAMRDRSVTLYDIAAAANLRTLLTNKNQFVVGQIQIPSIPACDGAVYVSGDSMYPILKSGDIVGFKEIHSITSVIYGEMYIVSFVLDDDEYLTVKYVNRSEKPNHLKLVSYNTRHEPMDLPFESINALAVVKFSIRKNMMM